MTFRDDLRREVRRQSIAQFDAATDQVVREFRSTAPTAPGAAGSVPFDTGELRRSFTDRSRSVSGTRYTVIVSVNATSRQGFDYPGFLNRSRRLGARRAQRRADGTLGTDSPGVDNYWRGYWDRFWDGTNRWEQALRDNQEQ